MNENYTCGLAVKNVLANIGIYSDSTETAIKKAVFERYIPADTAADKPADACFIRQLIYNVYDIQKTAEADDTVFDADSAISFIRKESENAIHEAFKVPTNRFRIHPMEHELSEDNSNTDKFLMDTGAGGAVINAPWKDGWNQNAENLEKLKGTAEMLKERKLHSWLYDERVYPSGWADGYVDTPDDRYIGRNIGISTVIGAGASNMTVELPDNGLQFIKAYIYDYSGFEIHYDTCEELTVSDKKVNFKGKSGLWIALVFYIRWGNIWVYKWATKLDPPIGPRKMINFLEKAAVDKFLEGALDVVADKIGFLGDYFEATFTDEPTLEALYQQGEKRRFAYESVPFGDEVFEHFQSKYGYDVKEKLPFLFFGDTAEAKRVRVHYWSVVGDLIAKNFTGNYQEKAHSYNLHFSGHLLGEETLFEHVGNYGNYMQAVSKMDYPGFDMCMGNNVRMWQRGTSAINCCIYAGAQSKLNGHNTTMVEVCPVDDQPLFLENSANNFEKIMTSTIFGGATWINAYGYRFVNDNSKFNHMNEYVGRVCLFAATGVSDAKIALYYPIEDMQANMREQTVEMYDLSDEAKALNTYFDSLHYYLYTNLLDFNIVNAQGLSESEIKDGKLNIKCMSYKAVLVPPVDMISLSSLKVLKKFADNGGKVYFLERIPSICDEDIPKEEFNSYIQNFEAVHLGLENKAFRSKVTASYTDPKYSTEPVTNGSDATNQCFDGWSSNKLPATLDIDFGEERTINHVELYSTNGHEQSGFKAQYFNGNEWITLCEKDGNTYPRMDGDFDAITTDHIRLVFEKGCKTDENIARLNEFQAYFLHHSDKPCEFTKQLHALCGNTLKISGAKADSLRMSRLLMNGKQCYFIVNIADADQSLDIRSTVGADIRLYDPMSGEFTDAAGSINYTLTCGKATFITEQ